ncbi:esterase-like activity of phytase family protein [Marivirga atlantica]|jgi:hypothetical protein|uniref:Esterase-like activity of phytase family protein n=1 Tax=Marivirga atlantica TaxID=1548457 RepID=A0A937AC19_9BACT|nr:esterase-like activity of phytase family protein [Marivirga atlantica]MBL0766181.1 esterase-like activity of phytase family protein [Marivirga atlantica]
MYSRIFLLIVVGSFLLGCNPKIDKSSEVKFIDKYVIGDSSIVDNTILGGLSSIDYDGNAFWYFISDDRSEYNDARYYRARIDYTDKGIDTVIIGKTVFLKNDSGFNYREHSLDPEAIRFHQNRKTLIYTSEGGRQENNKAPFIREMDTLGNLIKSYKVPTVFNYYETKGLRKNGGFESLTFENDTIIWFANELPLKEDGDVPKYAESKRPIRLTRFDIKNEEVLAEYAYPIEPVQAITKPANEFNINSVTELISLSETELLVLERSYITGVGNFVNVFKVNVSNATNVMDEPALTQATFTAVDKELFIDLNQYGERVDNIEGMAFGRDFDSETKSLLFVSDNNFSSQQETQIWLFGIPADRL